MRVARDPSRAVLPSLAHLSPLDFEHVYEPQEDTWLLCDALLADSADLVQRRPALAVEIGPGSGAVSCYVERLLAARGSAAAVIACDVNPLACAATVATARANGARTVDAITCDLLGALAVRLRGAVDLLLFNPPYVPTPDDEVGVGGIAAAWAGGERGRAVLDRVLPELPRILARPHGVAYLVAVEENDPDDVCRVLEGHGLAARRVASRKAYNERLTVLKISWPCDPHRDAGSTGAVGRGT